METARPDIYQTIEQQAMIKAGESEALIERFILGLTWSCCRIRNTQGSSIGFAMSPQEKTRLLTWPGTIAGTDAREAIPLFHSWNPFDATLGLATCNGVINTPDNSLLQQATIIPPTEQANLAVFSYFRQKLYNKRIVIIGRYPHLESVLSGINYQVLERQPSADDLPDTAAESLLPEADWVFITATSLINKTFARLSTLAENAVTVLMGPSLPWLADFAEYDVDFMAGVIPIDRDKTEQIAAEGGGTRLFEGGVQYAVANLSAQRLARLQDSISTVAGKRQQLKDRIENQQAATGKTQTSACQTSACQTSAWKELEQLDIELSGLDSAYKRLWDANQ